MQVLTHAQVHARHQGANERGLGIGRLESVYELSEEDAEAEAEAIDDDTAQAGRYHDYPAVSAIRWQWWQDHHVIVVDILDVDCWRGRNFLVRHRPCLLWCGRHSVLLYSCAVYVNRLGSDDCPQRCKR